VSFEGFPDEGLVFYEGLEADNSKTYWTRNKAAYDRMAQELTARFEANFQTFQDAVGEDVRAAAIRAAA